MSKLFLAGGGDEIDSQIFDDKFKEYLRKRDLKQIIYIPIALCKSKLYDNTFNWITNIFKEKEFEVIEWKELRSKRVSELQKADSLYIGGGNTYYLLEKLREAKLSQPVKEFSKNKPVYGGSAGAILFGKTILTAYDDVNDSKLVNFEGLNCLSDHSIWPHYSKEQDKGIRNFVRKHNHNIIAISETAGIYYDGTYIKKYGRGEAYIFRVDGEKVPVDKTELTN